MRRINLFLIAVFIWVSGVGNKAQSQQISIGTNMFDYLALGTLNLQMSYSLNKHYSLFLESKYNPFSFGSEENRKQLKQMSIAVGTKYWPWFVNSSWFFSGAIFFGKYNYGGVFTNKSYEGRAFGGNFGGGYAWMLGKRLNLEIGLGAFVGTTHYRRYSCVVCGVEEVEKSKVVVVPSDVQIALSFIF